MVFDFWSSIEALAGTVPTSKSGKSPRDERFNDDARRSLVVENAANLLLGMATDYRQVSIVRCSQHSLENVAAETLIVSAYSDIRFSSVSTRRFRCWRFICRNFFVG